VLAAVTLVLFAHPFAGIFVDEPAVTEATANALCIIAIGIAAAGVAPLASAYFQSLDYARPSLARCMASAAPRSTRTSGWSG
jgi:Na+-driven multidrug efflux pump